MTPTRGMALWTCGNKDKDCADYIYFSPCNSVPSIHSHNVPILLFLQSEFTIYWPAGLTRQHITQKPFQVFGIVRGTSRLQLTRAHFRDGSSDIRAAHHAPTAWCCSFLWRLRDCSKVELNVTHVSEYLVSWLDVYNSMSRIRGQPGIGFEFLSLHL